MLIAYKTPLLSIMRNIPNLGSAIPSLGLLYAVLALPSIACDPVGDLKNIGIKFKSLPQVIEEPNNKWPGDYTFGVIHVRSLEDCKTLIHEYVHAWQDERDGGPAQSYPEWWAREMQAEQLAKRAMQ